LLLLPTLLKLTDLKFFKSLYVILYVVSLGTEKSVVNHLFSKARIAFYHGLFACVGNTNNIGGTFPYQAMLAWSMTRIVFNRRMFPGEDSYWNMGVISSLHSSQAAGEPMSMNNIGFISERAIVDKFILSSTIYLPLKTWAKGLGWDWRSRVKL